MLPEQWNADYDNTYQESSGTDCEICKDSRVEVWCVDGFIACILCISTALLNLRGAVGIGQTNENNAQGTHGPVNT